jgi:hypothetical protein
MARIMNGPVWYNVERSNKGYIKAEKGNFRKRICRCKESPDWNGDKIDVYEYPLLTNARLRY